MKLRYVVLAVVAISFSPRDGLAGAVRVPSFGQALRGSGAPTLPAAWAGIWSYQDSAHTCADPSTITGTDSGLDTLCTGQGFGGDSTGFSMSCSGTVNDNSGDITCTGGGQLFPGCDVQYTVHFVATRNGEQAFIESTFDVAYSPSLCAFIPNSCDVTESTTVRIAPEPASCTTPVKKQTWGGVKVHYR